MDNPLAPSIAARTTERIVRSADELDPGPERQRVPAGTILFREGETPAGVYILYSGRADLIWRLGGPGERRRAAGAGEILGLSAVISGGPYLSSAVARTACMVGFVALETFSQLVENRPSVWFSVLRQLSRDVNESYDLIRKRPKKTAR
jgi:SulP family sulfate permease